MNENRNGRKLSWGHHFHYETFCGNYDECAEVVQDGWGNNLKACQDRLRDWSKTKFKRRQALLKELKRQLAELK